MKVPYSWLKDYVDVDLGPEELANRLTMAGLEVDRVEYPWPGVVTAEIVQLERIKGSDHLSATHVTTGDGRELSVVCGAPNIKLHDRVPLAQLGTKIGDMTIGEKKTMGVVSQGMLCSPRELGISDDHSGILILPPDTPLGVPLGKVLGDAVIELDIKAHRGDLFCVVGVAREVAAFLGTPLKPPVIHTPEQGTPASRLMKLDVRVPDLCPRYTARVVRDVKIGPSPEWMAERLAAAGMRPINNVVDITNYVMLELGQPLHAFDYDRVAEHHIIVRAGKPGEEITTLDGVTRRLTPEMVLVTDPAGPTVIAGIFGGERPEVHDGTTNVILEAAHWNPTNIRRTSQSLGLRTESSGRFEKNPDIELTAVACDRAAQLILELAGGTLAPGRVDFYPEPPTRRVLLFDTEQVPWLAGLACTPAEASGALRALGFTVEPEADERYLNVTVPTWRGDVQESADLVEEVARNLGYDRIPSTIPTGPLPEPTHDGWFEREEDVRDVLVGAGLTEIVTYSLISRASMARLLANGGPGVEGLLTAPASVPETESATSEGGGRRTRSEERRELETLATRLPAITLHNPMSSEFESLRLTLMPGLLATLRDNAKHSDAGLWFFELGRRYIQTPGFAEGTDLAEERRSVGVALLGPAALAWDAPARPADFYDVKGIAETLLQALKVRDYRFVPVHHPTFHSGRCAALEVAVLDGVAVDGHPGALAKASRWQRTGVLGEVHPEVAERFDLTGRAYLMELDLERLYAGVSERLTYTGVSRFPAVARDLALVVDAAAPEADVRAMILTSGGGLLRQARLFDVYTGEHVGMGKKSLAYALTYGSNERTLTDREADEVQQGILAALAERFGATLRA
jgi:phenylalanyl-tRNA synthetase beta chain